MRKLTAILGTGVVATSALVLTTHNGTAVAQSAPPSPPTATIVAASPILTEFRSGTIDVEDTKGAVASKASTVSFQGREVISAEVLLKGFDVRFTDAEHPVHEQKVKFDNIKIQGENVSFDTHLLIRDNSGNIDDTYAGDVDYVVIARTR